MRKKKKWLIILASPFILVPVLGLTLFLLNSTPRVAAISLADPAAAARPLVVKIHAQWCPGCLLTKGTVAKLQTAYGGRVNLVVFDITSEQTTATSRAEASRLGLQAFFDEHSGEPGALYVLDGVSKEVRGSLHGIRSLEEYAAEIDRALAPAARPGRGV